MSAWGEGKHFLWKQVCVDFLLQSENCTLQSTQWLSRETPPKIEILRYVVVPDELHILYSPQVLAARDRHGTPRAIGA